MSANDQTLRVWKYKLEAKSQTTTVNLPDKSRILQVKRVGSETFLWALVDSSQPCVSRTIAIVETGDVIDSKFGWPISNPDGLRYINTCGENDGYITHAFEIL